MAHAKPRNHCPENIIDHLSEAKSRIRARHNSQANEGAVVVVSARWTDVGGVNGIYRGLLCLLEFCNVTQYTVQTGN